MSNSTATTKYWSFLEMAPLTLFPTKRDQNSFRIAKDKHLTKLREISKDVSSTIRAFIILAVFCNTLFVGIAFVVLPFLMWRALFACLFLLVTVGLYSLTYLGDPANNGRRKWKRFVDSFVIPDITKWFNGQVVVKYPLDQSKQYIFAFAPHGVMPLTALWMFQHETWKNMFQGIDVVPLGSSVFHYAPLIRDIAMWVGTRQASKKAFVKTIREGKSVMIIPGGISEMKHTKSHSKTIVLDAKHKGFIKLAIQEGKDIVPVYSYGETKPFDLVNVPFISHALLKYMKMPFPYFIGLGGIFQIPKREKITAVVGKPIRVNQKEHPTEKDVNRIHRQYYRRLHALFEENKHLYGHKDHRLHVINIDGLFVNNNNNKH